MWLKHEYEAQAAQFGYEVDAYDYEDDITKFLQITENIAQKGGYDLVVARTPLMDARNSIKAIQESGAIYFHISSAGWEYMKEEELCQGLVCGEYGQGVVLGERAAEELPENANVVVLMGPAGKRNSIDRNQGWHDVLDKKRPDVTFLDTQVANWSKEEAMKKMDDWQQTFDKIDGVLSCNDNMATGAVESLLVAGFGDWENMYIYGVDGLNSACNYISKGYMKGSALGDAREYARITFELFNKHVAGEYDMNSPAWYDFPSSLVDASNVQDMIAYYEITP